MLPTLIYLLFKATHPVHMKHSQNNASECRRAEENEIKASKPFFHLQYKLDAFFSLQNDSEMHK